MRKINYNYLHSLIKILVLFLSLFYTSITYSKDNGVILGFSLSELDNDFAAGLNITTPQFWNNNMAIRYSAYIGTYRAIPKHDSTYKFMTYHLHKIGLVRYLKQNKNINLYSEGGVVIVFPNQDMSVDTSFGGYGNLGIEYMQENNAYFSELGAIGTGAKAEKISGEPIYLNGFTVTVGWRYYFE